MDFNFGNKLKELRTKRNITQEELANSLGETKGAISQLESGKITCTVDKLVEIARFLGISPTEFFTPKNIEKVVYSKDEFTFVDNQQLGSIKHFLVNSENKYQMEPIILKINPNGVSEIHSPHLGEDFGYVLSGSITLVLDNYMYKVKKGEVFYFKSDKEHQIKNTNDGNSEILWIHSPANFKR
jgi:transcriptional regulator with XRE-family HTH domain